MGFSVFNDSTCQTVLATITLIATLAHRSLKAVASLSSPVRLSFLIQIKGSVCKVFICTNCFVLPNGEQIAQRDISMFCTAVGVCYQ